MNDGPYEVWIMADGKPVKGIASRHRYWTPKHSNVPPMETLKKVRELLLWMAMRYPKLPNSTTAFLYRRSKDSPSSPLIRVGTVAMRHLPGE